MLEAAGYPEQQGALARVADHLRMPSTTLSGWANGKHNPPPTELRCEKKDDLINFIKAEIPQVFRELADARPDASYRDLMVGLGILVDKWQLLSGEATERSEVNASVRLQWPDASNAAEAP